MSNELGFEVRLAQPFESALSLVKEALKAEGFGVLTEIDVRKTMREKLGVEFHPYVIFGACNPPLAYKALSEDPITGLLLPCNVTLEDDQHGGSIVRLVNPEAMLTIGSLEGNTAVAEVASQARSKLERVAEALLAL